MHASREEGGRDTSNPKSSEKGNEQEGQKPRGGVLEGSKEDSDDCPAESWPGTCISEVTRRKAASGWGWLIAGRSEGGERD